VTQRQVASGAFTQHKASLGQRLAWSTCRPSVCDTQGSTRGHQVMPSTISTHAWPAAAATACASHFHGLFNCCSSTTSTNCCLLAVAPSGVWLQLLGCWSITTIWLIG